MEAFTKQEVISYLDENLKEWTFQQNTIRRYFKFKTFVEAFSFMTAIALESEKMNHHPDWSNSFNKVEITLTNHAAKGVTRLDFELAAKIDNLFSKYLITPS